MTLPFLSGNLGGYNIAPSQINLITALGSGGSDVSDTFKVQGGSLYVIAQAASGQAVISAKVDSVTPITDPASGGTSVTVINTSKSFIKLDGSTTNLYGAIKIVDSNWSSALSVCDIFVLYETPTNKNFLWYSPDSVANVGNPINSSLPR